MLPISGANAPSYTTPPTTIGDDGARFRCRVINDFGEATSNEAILTVTGNSPPAATIDTPVAGALYSFNQTINYSGTGTDAQDGTLGEGAFTWRIDFHHASHAHPFLQPASGSKTGSFQADFAETSANVFYRIYLTVVDSSGTPTTVTRDVTPRTSTIRLQTQSPGGLQLILDSIPVSTPHTFVGVEGQPRTIGAVSPQTSGGKAYVFRSWSDGGAQSHTINTPTADTTYSARYRRQ
jgi:hypothetical protein